MRLDAHQHFWIYDPAEHVWMTDAHAALRRPFLPEDLKPLLASAGFDGSIAVQARQSLTETEWLLDLARRHPFIKGVVGWVDLCSPAVGEQLAAFAADPRLKGVRHVVHDEPDDQFVLRADFGRGIARLEDYGLTYDLLLFPRHLPPAIELVRRFPRQFFVLDHIAKPPIREGRLLPWADDLRRLAELANVHCKLSGLVTEADWGRWMPERFAPYLDVVFDAFGPERLMIGSDWPVCTVSGDYAGVMGVIVDYVRRFPEATQARILGGNSAAFYRVGAER